MAKQAVLTGDISNFTRLPSAVRQTLIGETERFLSSGLLPGEAAATFRGDSYQVLSETPGRAIKKSIQLICWFKTRPEAPDLNTRISIGIGRVSYRNENVLNSDGSAFHRSGRNFDSMEPETYLSIITGRAQTDKTLQIILNFVNRYIEKWTRAQAEVITLQMDGLNQQSIAEKLSITQPSVNSRLKSAGWREIEPALEYIINTV